MEILIKLNPSRDFPTFQTIKGGGRGGGGGGGRGQLNSENILAIKIGTIRFMLKELDIHLKLI